MQKVQAEKESARSASHPHWMQWRLARAGRSLETCAAWLELRPGLVLLLLAILYCAWITRHERQSMLWHDELYTFYIAQAPSFRTMLHWANTVDMNPPLYYIAARFCMHLLPAGRLAVRMPSIVGYATAMMCTYAFVSRRMTPLYGALGVFILMMPDFSYYALQARPYALMLACIGIAAVSWQSAQSPRSLSRLAGLAGVFLGSLGLLLSHVLAVFALAALVVAEAARAVGRRKIDWPMTAALSLPWVACITYLPLLHYHSTQVYPPAFQATSVMLGSRYAYIWMFMAPSLAMTAVIFALLGPAGDAEQTQRQYLSGAETLFALGLLAVPFAAVLLFLHAHAAYFNRYGLAASLGLAILFPYGLARWGKGSSRNALVACVVFFFAAFPVTALMKIVKRNFFSNPIPVQMSGSENLRLESIQSGLPFVDASGLTFLEMNRREAPEFLQRVYYLEDFVADKQYARATIFEELTVVKTMFPIRAQVQDYSQFTQQHRQFLVLGTYTYPEDWLLRKLLADGARLDFLGIIDNSYKDHELYLVTMGAAQPEPDPQTEARTHSPN